MTLASLDDDIAFDAVYPAEIRRISRRFWTPVAVARRAAQLFTEAGAKRVLDVGAGVGKFVLVAAEAAPAIHFVGIEHRRHLVDVASRAREALGRDNARFKAADVTRMGWSAFDGFYLFNPFAENLFEGGDCIDRRVELSTRRLSRDALRVERALLRGPVGTSVVTYHGATARIPGCYEIEACERAGTDWLRLWVRRREIDDGSLFVEEAAGVVRQVAGATHDVA
jgi:SAM-dependent methyltransferase